MSELALYIVATVVVLAGVAYFFVKQREQEALAQRKPRAQKQQKAKKETRETKEPRERIRKPREKKEVEQPAPTSKKAKKEENENSDVLNFLKGKKFTNDKSSEGATQAKVRSAPAVDAKKVAPTKKAAKPVVVESDSESGSDSDEYEKVTRKIKTSNNKEKPEEEAPVVEGEKKGKKKPKFFTKQEEDEHKAGIAASKAEYEARKAEREARKNRPPGEKRERKPRAEGEGEFTEVRQRRPRKERAEGETGEDDGEDNDRRRKFPPREPDQPPVFASEYEAADMDNILNNLTNYYAANPEAGRKPKAAKRPAAEESSKADSEE